MKTQQRQDTNIEKKLERWLNENRVVFEKQKPIAGLTIVDFYIPSMKVLYADGDYWHSLPNVIARDKRINETLKAMGYHVYRLTGTQIKNGIRPVEILSTN
jgi:very-short-patch-repair endonuclease